jgi:hypothetical protein
MKLLHKALGIGALWFCLLAMPHGLLAQTPSEDNGQQVITLLKEQNSHLSGELRRIQREIAALRAELEKPGFKDIMAGVGYILGLFGVAAFVASRRKE